MIFCLVYPVSIYLYFTKIIIIFFNNHHHHHHLQTVIVFRCWANIVVGLLYIISRLPAAAHTRACLCIFVYMRAHARVCVRACVRICACVSALSPVCVCVSFRPFNFISNMKGCDILKIIPLRHWSTVRDID